MHGEGLLKEKESSVYWKKGKWNMGNLETWIEEGLQINNDSDIKKHLIIEKPHKQVIQNNQNRDLIEFE